MDDTIPEVLIASSNACFIYDAHNANEMATYKDENPFSPKTVSLIGEDYLIGAYSNKPKLKVWPVNKKVKSNSASFVVPGIVSALAVSNCGNYCIAGIKDQIYVWEVSSGEVMMILSRHYQPVTCLKFTDDDSRFFSGGKDGHVIVWILSCVIDVTAREDTVKPQFVWNKHSAEVTDIYCGFTISRVATTSLDMTCKVYELDSGMLLSSICMDVALTSVVMDPLEYFIFLGDDRGYLYKINTYERLPHEIHRADVDNKAALKLHETKIISLGVSLDGRKLMTASEDRTCKLWDMLSMSCVLNVHIEGALNNAFLAPIPSCLSDETVKPEFCFRQFQREMSSTGKEYIETKTRSQQLSLIYDGCPDNYYPHSVFCSKPAVMVSEEDIRESEEIFHEQVDGESISSVTELNRQIYTLLVDKKLDLLFGCPLSPS